MELIEVIRNISAICVIFVSIAGGVAALFKVLNFYSEYKEFKKKCEGYETEINDLNTKTDAKLQEIRAEQEMITYCMRAVLDGLHQLNCNGAVTTASTKLDEYLNKQAHQVV